MEITCVKAFIEYYSKIRERTNRLIRIIPHDRLDWAYMPGKFTIGDMIRHIGGIERYMFAEIVASRNNVYRGCGKELADGYENVVIYFNELHTQSMAIFSNLTDDDLQQKCITPGGTPVTTWKWLRAMTEHEIHHRGQLYIFLNMLGVKTPPLFGLSEEEVKEKSQ